MYTLSLAPPARLTAFIVLALALGCARAPETCPGGTAPDEDGARALIARLASTPEGEGVVRRLGSQAPRVCVGRVPVSAVTTDGTILLDAALDEAEAAARLGHLLVHVVEGLPGAASAGGAAAGGCDAEVARALAAEARALALELRLRRALGVRAPRLRYELEGDFWEAEPGAREGLILGYLAAHPGGGPGIDAIAEGYARRCRERERPEGGAR